jgi:hypothetical protein
MVAEISPASAHLKLTDIRVNEFNLSPHDATCFIPNSRCQIVPWPRNRLLDLCGIE